MATLLSAGAVAGYMAWKNPSYAEVVSVEPVKQIITTPEKICSEEQVTRRAPAPAPSDYVAQNPGLGGRVISGMGRLPVGTGSGGKVFSGSIASTAAQDVREDHGARPQQKKPEKASATTITHCRTVTQASERVVAYDVRYRLHGRTSKIRMNHDPGKRIPVKDGKLVLLDETADGPGFRG
jgi:uncharacterized protein YcfJ